VLLLKYSVHCISLAEQIQIKCGFIVIFMAETVACVVEKIICYVWKRKTYRIVVQKCEGMR
jgi:hypothetical protein